MRWLVLARALTLVARVAFGCIAFGIPRNALGGSGFISAAASLRFSFGGSSLGTASPFGRVTRITGPMAGVVPSFTTSAHSVNGGFTLARSAGASPSRLSWSRKRLYWRTQPSR